MEAIVPILVIVVFVLVIYSSIQHQARLDGLVDQWAARGDYRIVEREVPWFRTGPYWMRSKSQKIYRVVVIDTNGRQRCAWLRCGGAFWSDNVDVEWED